jgi:hypothetical protein
MSTTILHQGPAYELSLAIDPTKYGHHLRLISFVPIARRPERQVRFQTVLSRDELEVLHEAIGHALLDTSNSRYSAPLAKSRLGLNNS